ncbi:MAG: helix-turn-helix domain-containing protein [Melioribacteraceae bacterium]|nr:helix-turn-helix domain-containing protein [Melioribacteraceae bacterium]
MKQPELGKKILELRKEKGYTQEELAHECKVNVRSIQRIENGDVNPRMATLLLLQEVLDHDFKDVKCEETKSLLLIMHISSIFPIVLVPLLIWIRKKDISHDINVHGRDVINFQLSMMIYLFASSFLVLLIIGLPILMLLGPFIFFLSVFNTIRVANGQSYKYPFTIKFID